MQHRFTSKMCALSDGARRWAVSEQRKGRKKLGREWGCSFKYSGQGKLHRLGDAWKDNWVGWQGEPWGELEEDPSRWRQSRCAGLGHPQGLWGPAGGQVWLERREYRRGVDVARRGSPNFKYVGTDFLKSSQKGSKSESRNHVPELRAT